MNPLRKLSLFLIPLLLVGCAVSVSPNSQESSQGSLESTSSSKNEDTSISISESSSSIPSEESKESSKSSIEESEEESSEEPFSSEESIEESSEELSSFEESVEESSPEESSTPEREKPTNETYHFYCVNDFHGSVLEQKNGWTYESGIAKYFGMLKRFKEKDPEHTIILSAGDMFQGSMESNYNFGALVTDAMNAVPFDAMTVGNHEFDYGPDKLLDIIDRADFPVLGGNVMKYENGTATNEPWSDKIFKSTILEKGKARIGIVGMIGAGQTSSITSEYVKDMHFPSSKNLASNEAKRLREQEDCDLVFFVVHDTYKNVSFAGNHDLFDGVFTAHTHQKEEYVMDEVPFVQSYCNGQAYSHISITFEDGEPFYNDYSCNSVSSSTQEDAEIASIRDSYILAEPFASLANAEAGVINGTLSKGEGVPNIGCKAIYDHFIGDYPDLCCAMMNSQRAELTGEITYRDINKATPFLNRVVIACVSGHDIIREASYNLSYTDDLTRFGAINENTYYTIACIDFILLHRNDSKQYDYFPSLSTGGYIIESYLEYPFDLIFHYIKDDLGGVVNASDFSNTNPNYGCYA